jgi:FG-GAP-like repeat
LVRLTKKELTIRNRVSGGWGSVVYRLAVGGGGEGLAFGDFNGGGRTDIYVLCQKGNNSQDNPDYILLNQGSNSYTKHTLGATGGSGDDVAPLDYNVDGKMDFVVTNGDRKKAGPVQLFSWR